MAKGPRYRHEAREYIVLALDTMIENLSYKLQISESVSYQLDTPEAIREMEEDFEMESTEEDRELYLEEARTQSIAGFGHIQRRLDEVRRLKAALESPEPPSSELVEKTYIAIRDSIVFNAIRRHGLVLEHDKSKWNAERHEQERLEKLSLHHYSQALMLGFGLWPQMSWHCFPFDDL